MTLKQRIINQSLAIRTFSIDPICKICNNFSMQDHETVKPFKSSITEWLKPTIDLSEFEYLYPVNGITEGLNYWMWQETRQITMKKDDYAWVTGKENGEVLYISMPSSVDGNYCEIPTDVPVILDIAYVGSAALKKIHVPSNVEKVFYSFSKSFGLRNYRTGYYWSRIPDAKIGPLIQHGKYYNYYAQNLAEEIINQISIDEVYKCLRPYQELICNELSVVPSDVVWLATSSDSDYNKFFRNYTNRLCIADIIKERYSGSF